MQEVGSKWEQEGTLRGGKRVEWEKRVLRQPFPRAEFCQKPALSPRLIFFACLGGQMNSPGV